MQVNMQSLARLGASTRLGEIERERTELLAAFPDLEPPVESIKRGLRQAANGQGRVHRKRKPMPAWRRRQVSKRMTAYWAAKRAAKR